MGDKSFAIIVIIIIIIIIIQIILIVPISFGTMQGLPICIYKIGITACYKYFRRVFITCE